MMIDLTIQINFMYKHNVTDLVYIHLVFISTKGGKKPPKNEKTEYEIPHYRHKTVV